MNCPQDRIWVPLDVQTLDEAKKLIDQLLPAGIRRFKVGLELATAVGSVAAVECVRSLGGEVWYDGKFCDIPNTVAGAAKAVAKLGVDMFNVHASCGMPGIKAAVDNRGSAKVLVVTVLTSLDGKNLEDIGYPQGTQPIEIVKMMTLLAWQAKADGVVCSPQELAVIDAMLRGFGPNASLFEKVTPGVRPWWAVKGDQKRVMTPLEAKKAGATAYVIGRPITNPPPEIGTPADAVKRICEEIA